MNKTIIIIEDHPIFRRGLKDLISNYPGFEVVADSANAVDGIKVIEEFNPDFLILDIGLPDINGIELTEQLTRDFPLMKILVISMHNKSSYVQAALLNGAEGYLTKDAAPENLFLALKTIAEGTRYIDPALQEELHQIEMEKSSQVSSLELLTTREKEILNYILKGMKPKEVSEILNISPRTVENHKASIMGKLGMSNNFELWKFAVQEGLIHIS